MTVKKKIDLGNFDTVAACNKPFKLEFRNPSSNEGLGCGVVLLGKDSDRFSEYTTERENARIKERFEAAQAGRQIAPPTVEQNRHDGTESIVVCTQNFWCDEGEGFLEWNGKFAYSVANAFKLYEAFPSFRKQSDEAIVNLANFMKG